MSKPKPPTPANDHLAAFGKTDDLDRLTDAEIQARLDATGETLMRALDLRILRTREETMALLEARAQGPVLSVGTQPPACPWRPFFRLPGEGPGAPSEVHQGSWRRGVSPIRERSKHPVIPATRAGMTAEKEIFVPA